MRSNYKPLGQYIRLVDKRNTDLENTNLIGLSIQKKFIPSISNTIGTDMSTYRIIEPRQFAYSQVTSRNGEKVTIALYSEEKPAIISQAYTVFEVSNKNELLPEYLMMWFSRPEFDRYARYMSHGSVRELFAWEDLCSSTLPVPPIDNQKEIVKEYNTIVNRINLNNQIIQKLEETAQAIYKHWFVDFEFPDENGNPYKSSGGEMVESEVGGIPAVWAVNRLVNISELKYGKMLDEKNYTPIGYTVFSGYGDRGFCHEFMYEDPQIVVLARGVSGTGKVRMSPPRSFITNLSIIVEIKKSSISKMFLFHYLSNQHLRYLDSGSAQSQITINDLGNVRILCPDIKYQNLFEWMTNHFINHFNCLKENSFLMNQFVQLFLSKLVHDNEEIML